MQITIDTKHDSHDDIMKAIQLLHHFTGKSALTNTPSEPIAQEPTPSVDLSSMFGQEPTTPTQPQESPLAAQNAIADTPPDFSSYLNLGKQQEKKEEPKVELF